MLHDHHNHCEHVLKFCDKCDRPYCTKCKREWYTQTFDWRWYGTYTNPVQPQWTTGIINTAGTAPIGKGIDYTTVSCSHA